MTRTDATMLWCAPVSCSAARTRSPSACHAAASPTARPGPPPAPAPGRLPHHRQRHATPAHRGRCDQCRAAHRTMPPPAVTATVTVSPRARPTGYTGRYCRKSRSRARQRRPRTGAPGRAPRPRTSGPPAPAPPARPASRSPEPPAQSSAHPPFPRRPPRENHGVDADRSRRHHPKWHDGLRGANRTWDRLAGEDHPECEDQAVELVVGYCPAVPIAEIARI